MEQFVWVRRQFNDYRLAKYRLQAMRGVHWDEVSGGVQATAPRPFLHGYVLCTEMLEGELAHSCEHGPPPHEIKVCILKSDNDPQTFGQLVDQAGGPLPKQIRLPSFWQWLKLSDQLDRKDAIGDFAREITSRTDRPKRNTLEGWKRRLGLAKRSAEYADLANAWNEYRANVERRDAPRVIERQRERD